MLSNADAKLDPRVKAVRADALLGNGTCSYIDECWDARDLVEAFDRDGADTPEKAVKWAYEQEGITREQGTNCSSGEPDCPLIEGHREWQEKMAAR